MTAADRGEVDVARGSFGKRWNLALLFEHHNHQDFIHHSIAIRITLITVINITLTIGRQ